MKGCVNMAKYFIEGGNRISGELSIHGAKNAALPILAATLLCQHSEIHNCPQLSDVMAACNILKSLGCKAERQGSTIIVDSSNVLGCEIPDELMREMRSSVVFLGAIIVKCGKARISFPGGCELGPRPIDMHLDGLKKLGVIIKEDHGYLDCTLEQRAKGTDVNLPFPSVGATENIMLVAVTAEGTTIIHNAAREPEIADLAGYLRACGANIAIRGDGTIVIEGVEKLKPSVEYTVIPDRIATATYLCTAAITGGEILIKNTEPSHLAAVLPVFEEMGCKVTTGDRMIYLRSTLPLKPVKMIRTMPYPAFPTDAQSPLMAVTTTANGTSVFVENIFESRYKHVTELVRLGAKIKVEGRVAVVDGVDLLHSATLQCTDLRGGAALCVAALAAQGISEITETKHIERGYEDFDINLSLLGAKITRE